MVSSNIEKNGVKRNKERDPSAAARHKDENNRHALSINSLKVATFTLD
jgi:hypothetical protein